MTCTPICVQPSPTQAHCGTYHLTFGGVRGFDRHRRRGVCVAPDVLGYTNNGSGVYRMPIDDAGRQRLARPRGPQTAETGPGVVQGATPKSETAKSPTGGMTS